jgi:hypothetical protein
MFIFLCRFAPGGLTLRSTGLKKGKKAPGEKLPALTPAPDGVDSGENYASLSRQFCNLDSPLPAPETPSIFHPRAQQNAFRRRDVRLQGKVSTSAVRFE